MAPIWPQEAPIWPEDGPRMNPRGLHVVAIRLQTPLNTYRNIGVFAFGVHLDPEMAQYGAKLAPNLPQDGPKRANSWGLDTDRPENNGQISLTIAPGAHRACGVIS